MKKFLLVGLLGVAVLGLVIQAPQPAQAGRGGNPWVGLAILGVVTTAVAVSQMTCDRPSYRPYYSYHSYCPPTFYWQIGYDYRHYRPRHHRPHHYRPRHYRPHHRPDHHRPEFRDPRPARGSDGWDTRGGQVMPASNSGRDTRGGQPGPSVNSGWDTRGGGQPGPSGNSGWDTRGGGGQSVQVRYGPAGRP